MVQQPSHEFYQLPTSSRSKDESDVSCCKERMHEYLNRLNSQLGKSAEDSVTTSNLIIPYATLCTARTGNPSRRDNTECTNETSILSKLAVVKLNGGLGTSMGCIGPKSAIEVREGHSFLDLTVKQLEFLNDATRQNIPLILMNSFNTDEETVALIQKYVGRNVQILTFNQSRFPRIDKATMSPLASTPYADKQCWYPPGHGDFFASIAKCGLLERLIEMGKEYLFVSNIDNLGATVDPKILAYVLDSRLDFLMEVTDKTRVDVKGGTLIEYKDRLQLLEMAQVPAEHLSEICCIRKFKIFNTNNIWIRTRAIQDTVGKPEFQLDIIANPKTIESNGRQVIQLETALGAGIKHFQHSQAVNVPRCRFLPVKTCSDLFLIQSDLYTLQDGFLTLNPLRPFLSIPLIKLGKDFRKVHGYKTRIHSPLQVTELEQLTVIGDVHFGEKVTLKGTVIIVAEDGCRIDIPAGAFLEDKVVIGNLRIIET